MPIFEELWEPRDEIMIYIITLSNDLIASPIFLCLGAIYQLKKQQKEHSGKKSPLKAKQVGIIVKKVVSNRIILGNLAGLLYVCTNLPVPTY